MRVRTCLNGNNCAGSSRQSISCNTNACPSSGVWTGWTTWGTCSQTCSGGTQQRTRHCVTNSRCLSLTVQMYCFNLILFSSSHQHCSVHIISYCFSPYIRSSHIHTVIINVFLLHIIYVLHYIIMYFTTMLLALEYYNITFIIED